MRKNLLMVSSLLTMKRCGKTKMVQFQHFVFILFVAISVLYVYLTYGTVPFFQQSALKMLILPGLKPFFVIQTYLYSKSKSFNGMDAIVTLFNAERLQYNILPISCYRELDNGKIQNKSGKITQLIDGPVQCKLTLFRLVCLFPPSTKNTTKYSVGISLINETIQYGSLTVSEPNKKPYGFVSCMSRMIAFDDWALVIFAMEVFRLYGGDLAVAPVECAIKEVMDLLKLYEDDGILKIRAGFKTIVPKNVGYDPNTETEFNQMSSAHECFYEFKESAEFIAFTDWDDVLVGHRKGHQITSFYNSFVPFTRSHPKAAAYSISRFDAYLKSPIQKSNDVFSLGAAFRQSQYVSVFLDDKIIVRPHLVAGSWIHEMRIPEKDSYYQIPVNSSVVSMLHLHDTLADDGETKRLSTDLRMYENASHFVDLDLLDLNFKNMLDRKNFTFNHKKYPYLRLFYHLIYQCYGHILQDLFGTSLTYCPSIKTCSYPPQNITVVKFDTKFNNPIVTGPYICVLVGSSLTRIMIVNEFLKKILTMTSLINLCHEHWTKSGHCVSLNKLYTIDINSNTATGKAYKLGNKEGSYDADSPYNEVSLSLVSDLEYNPILYTHNIMNALILYAPGINAMIASSDSNFVSPQKSGISLYPKTDSPCFLEFDVSFCVLPTGISYHDVTLHLSFVPLETGLNSVEVLTFDPCDLTIIFINGTTQQLKKVHLYDQTNVKPAGLLRDWTPSFCSIGVKGISTGPIPFNTFSKVLSFENSETNFVEFELCEYKCDGFFKQTVHIVLFVFAILLFIVDIILLGLFLWFCVFRRLKQKTDAKKRIEKDENTETAATTNVGSTQKTDPKKTTTPEAGTPSRTPNEGCTTFGQTNDMTHMKMTLDL